MASHKKRGKKSAAHKKSSALKSTLPSLSPSLGNQTKVGKDDRGSSRRKEEEAAEDEEDKGSRLTLEALDAISDEEEEEEAETGGDDSGAAREAVDDEDDDEVEWNAEAQALRHAIAEGAFDRLGLDPKTGGGASRGEDEGSAREAVLETSSSSEGEGNDDGGGDDDDERDGATSSPAAAARALKSVTEELEAARASAPWAESFDVVASVPLPFEGSPLDVHDDLKREVSFYNLALDATRTARKKCDEAGVPFVRPDDFFAEMVKTDDHMAKVKDRLIFETKKMEAFERRKSNREIKLRAKESQANRIASKAKAKREHFKAVNDWAKTAAANRPSGGMVTEDDRDFLGRMGGGPNKKRVAANRKYGFGGGKTGHFKKTDRRALDDMSGFNPRGNFGSGGTKSKGGRPKRKGKRARDAARSRR